MELTVDMYRQELAAAVRTYDKHIVCLAKTPDQCRESLESLLRKAIQAYLHRPAGFRHGIALDAQLTIILSQTDRDRPLCSVYFNLFSDLWVQGQKTPPQP